MSERRSGRSRKPISYSSLGNASDSDDDFADSTPPVPKKQKQSKDSSHEKEKRNSSRKEVPSKSNSRKERLPVSQKIYERELHEALQLSLLETSASQGNDEFKGEMGTAISANVELEHSKVEAPLLEKVPPTVETIDLGQAESNPPPPMLSPVQPSLLGVMMDDSIETLVDEDGSGRRVRPRRCSGRQTVEKLTVGKENQAEDEADFDPDSEDDVSSSATDASDDDFSDGDSDFDDKKKKAAVKPKPKNTSKAKNAEVVSQTKDFKEKEKTVKKVKQIPVQPKKSCGSSSSLANVNVSSSVKTVTATKTTVQVPSLNSEVGFHKKSVSPLRSQWKPPAPAASNTSSSSTSTVKSPSTGLRLGLSRHQRVKPLHSSLSVS